MILLQDSNGNKYDFQITKFPDGSSQVWKINPEPAKMTLMEVTWFFENEAELFHICQLGDLLYKHFFVFPTLVCPFLPYSRQDKKISNSSTFARDTFIHLVVQSGYTRIRTYDAHSNSFYIDSKEPTELIDAALPGHDVVCFPDKGAKERYSKLFKGTPVIYSDKRRNQLTGVIEGVDLELNGVDISGKNVLVFDDICDGGKTFLEIAEKLNIYSPANLSLAVSHGLFSKGLDKMIEVGYSNFYTTNSLLRNSYTGKATSYKTSCGIQNINYEIVKVV